MAVGCRGWPPSLPVRARWLSRRPRRGRGGAGGRRELWRDITTAVRCSFARDKTLDPQSVPRSFALSGDCRPSGSVPSSGVFRGRCGSRPRVTGLAYPRARIRVASVASCVACYFGSRGAVEETLLSFWLSPAVAAVRTGCANTSGKQLFRTANTGSIQKLCGKPVGLRSSCSLKLSVIFGVGLGSAPCPCPACPCWWSVDGVYRHLSPPAPTAPPPPVFRLPQLGVGCASGWASGCLWHETRDALSQAGPERMPPIFAPLRREAAPLPPPPTAGAGANGPAAGCGGSPHTGHTVPRPLPVVTGKFCRRPWLRSAL